MLHSDLNTLISYLLGASSYQQLHQSKVFAQRYIAPPRHTQTNSSQHTSTIYMSCCSQILTSTPPKPAHTATIPPSSLSPPSSLHHLTRKQRGPRNRIRLRRIHIIRNTRIGTLINARNCDLRTRPRARPTTRHINLMTARVKLDTRVGERGV